jgi:hypothetical protein
LKIRPLTFDRLECRSLLAPLIEPIPPVVDAGINAIITPGEFCRAGVFTDPAPSSCTATVDYGDGSGSEALGLQGQSFDLEHVYAVPGNYVVSVIVTDAIGYKGYGYFGVTVMPGGTQASVAPDPVPILPAPAAMTSAVAAAAPAGLAPSPVVRHHESKAPKEKPHVVHLVSDPPPIRHLAAHVH